MKRLIAAIAVLALVGAQAGETKKVFFIFLNTGSNNGKLSKEDAAKMQSAHVGNLAELGKQGKGLFAGPFGDDGLTRGIVILDVKEMADIKECFKPDPFVQNRYLSVSAWAMSADTKRLHKPNEPFKMMQGQTVVIVKGDKFERATTPETIRQTVERFRTTWKKDAEMLEKSGLVGFQGLFDRPSNKLGVAILQTADKEKVKALLETTESFKQKFVEFEQHPQFYGEGCFAKESSE